MSLLLEPESELLLEAELPPEPEPLPAAEPLPEPEPLPSAPHDPVLDWRPGPPLTTWNPSAGRSPWPVSELEWDMPLPARGVLVLDDDAAQRELIRLYLQDDYDVVGYATADAALAALAQQHYDLVVSDIHLPGLDGLGFRARLAEMLPVDRIEDPSAGPDEVAAAQNLYEVLLAALEEPIRVAERQLAQAHTNRDRERARIQGLLTTAWGGANVLGPVIGGWIVMHTSWRWVFFVNVPFGLLSAVMLAYVRRSSQDAATKVDVALGYYVLNAVAVAMLNNWMRAPVIAMSSLLSWNTVVILVAAMIIPATPTRILAASLVAASADPLAVWLAHLRGGDVPGPLHTMVLFMPNYACAAVAVLPSRVLHHVGRTLRQAQEMGSYRLEELLGRGGMGEVWKASHRLLARSAAIKLVRPELMGASTAQETESMIRRFRRDRKSVV